MLGAPVQIAYAVDDVRRAAERWLERGVGPFFVLDHIALENVEVDGVPGSFDHSSAYAQWGDVMVELICHHVPPADRVGSPLGLHHVAFFVADFAAAANDLAAADRPQRLYAETSTGMPFAFHDAPDLGHLVEIYERVPGINRFYAMVRDAADGWDGSDPIRVLG